MENFIDKVFKQYPFIYKLWDKYYALGTGVCTVCDIVGSGSYLEKRYLIYRENMDATLLHDDAYDIFNKVQIEAENIKEKDGICLYPDRKIYEFGLSEKEMQELKNQVDDYVKFWKKNDLKEPYKCKMMR